MANVKSKYVNLNITMDIFIVNPYDTVSNYSATSYDGTKYILTWDSQGSSKNQFHILSNVLDVNQFHWFAIGK